MKKTTTQYIVERVTFAFAGCLLAVPALHGQAAPRGAVVGNASAAVQAATKKDIETSTITAGGKEFPKVRSLGASQSACCVPGETRHVSGQAEIMAELPKGTNKDKQEKFDSKYSPPMTCWAISKVTKSTLNSIGPVSATQDLVPPNYSFISTKTYETERQKLETYVTNLQIANYLKFDLNKKIESFAKNYSSYASTLSASHGTLAHYATLSGAGKFNGRTAYHANFGIDEICCPPEVRDAQAFYTMVKAWVDQRVSTHRKIAIEAAKQHRVDPKIFQQ